MKRKMFSFMTMVMVSAVITYCAAVLPATAGEKNSFVFAAGTEPIIIDPHLAQDNNTEDAVLMIHEGLVARGEDSSVEPRLATKWSVSRDGKTWTFELRKGVKFHDGTAFNAEAVKYNFERILNPETASPNRSAFTFIDRVEVLGEHEVAFRTKEPFGALLDLFTVANITMVSPAAAKKHGKEYGLRPVGTGPLMLDDWVKGVRLSFKRFDGYWGQKTAYEKLTWKTVPEEATRIMMLQVGEVDVIKGVAPIQIDTLKQDKNVRVVTKPGPRVLYLGMNQAHKPFDDVRVRRAVQHAINKDAIIKNALKGYAVPSIGVAAPVIVHAAKSVAPTYDYNPAKAKQLLAEAGYPNGLQATLMTSEGRYPMDRTVAEIVQGQLREVGIDLKLMVLEWGTYTKIRNEKKETRLYLVGWGCPPLDLDYFFSTAYQSGVPANTMNYSSADFDRLLEQQRKTVDVKARGEILTKMQNLLQSDSVWVNLYYQYQVHATRADVQGLRVNPNETLDLSGLKRH